MSGPRFVMLSIQNFADRPLVHSEPDGDAVMPTVGLGETMRPLDGKLRGSRR